MLDMKMWKVHICYLVLGCLLLATSPTHAQGLETTIYTTTNKTQTFESQYESTECALTLPDGTVCSYDNSSTTAPPPTEKCSFPNYVHPDGDYCSFEVNITTKSLSGIYTLNYTTNSTSREDKFYVYLHTDSVPSGELRIVESEKMYFLLEDSFGSADAKKCEAILSNGMDEVFLDTEWTTSHHWGKEGECGFKIENVSTSNGDDWTLRMSSTGAAYTYAFVNVSVISLDEISTGEEVQQIWILGGAETLELSTDEDPKYCELWNPRKEMVHKGPPCNYTQSRVTDADEGNWTFAYGFEGKILADIAVQEVRVITISDMEVNVSNSEIFENGMSLLCTVHATPVTSCSFTRPDGRVLLPSEGIWNADYSYFGEGFGSGDCGLTIHNVQDNDKGMWKCTVFDSSTTRFGFLNVSANVSDLKVNTTQSLVVGREREMLSLSCSAQATVNYCWFRHPSGVPLHFSTDIVQLDDILWYSYEDTLPQGVCTIRVLSPNSNKDSGVWTCNVGLSEISTDEYSVPITVGVSETNVISLEKEVVVSEDSAVLKCYSVPLETPLYYCRFIRPDGKGFIVDPQNNDSMVLGRYKYEGDGLEKGQCGLRIVSGINEDEDLGKWTCVARLQTGDYEGRDFITLKEEDGLSTGAIVGIVLGSIALLLVIGGSVFFIARCRKSK